MVDIVVIVHAMIECLIRVIEVELGISWIINSVWYDIGNTVINGVARF